MPAKSKSQQRLFGMVHAYNKGELHGPKSLKARIARLSKHISDEDAKHFAQTPHTGLPEKKASEEYAFKGDRVTIFGNIRCRHAGKKATVISTNHNGADKSRQVSVFKTDDGSVFSGYTDAYVATNHTSKAASALHKVAQVLMRPEEIQALVARLPPDLSDRVLPARSERRRSFLGTVLRGTAAGTVVGGLGAGALGGYLSHKVVSQQGQPSAAARQAVMKAALRCGVWGAARGAAGGAALGAGLGILNTVRG